MPPKFIRKQRSSVTQAGFVVGDTLNIQSGRSGWTAIVSMEPRCPCVNKRYSNKNNWPVFLASHKGNRKLLYWQRPALTKSDRNRDGRTFVVTASSNILSSRSPTCTTPKHLMSKRKNFNEPASPVGRAQPFIVNHGASRTNKKSSSTCRQN